MAGDESPRGKAKTEYQDSLRLIERLHRFMLDLIKSELDRQGRTDINSVQAMLLYNIGDNEITAGELKTRGYYMGSNVSYNLKKLVEADYVEHQRSPHDRRAVRIRVSDKGREICDMLEDLFDRQLTDIMEDNEVGEEGLTQLRSNLRALERLWSDSLRYSA